MDIQDNRLTRNIGVSRDKLKPGKVYIISQAVDSGSFHMAIAGSVSLVNLHTGVLWAPSATLLFVEVAAELSISTYTG